MQNFYLKHVRNTQWLNCTVDVSLNSKDNICIYCIRIVTSKLYKMYCFVVDQLEETVKLGNMLKIN